MPMQSMIFDLLRKNYYGPINAYKEPAPVKREKPFVLWIGCPDAPAAAISKLDWEKGKVLTYNRPANQINPDDPDFLNMLRYAIEVKEIQKIIVCGYSGCGSGAEVMAALKKNRVVEGQSAACYRLAMEHIDLLDQIPDEGDKAKTLSCLNVLETVRQLQMLQKNIPGLRKVEIVPLVLDGASDLLINPDTALARRCVTIGNE